MANLLSFNKRRTLFKAFVESQFKYCPIVWMFHSRRTNNKINRLHERALRIVYDDDVSTFDQLLAMDKSFCIHHQNIQRLLIEIYKALHDTSGNSLKEFFVKRESTISLRSKPELVIPSVNSILKGKISLRYFASVIWNSLPIEIREDHLISSFVTKIKQWKPIACPCTVCKSYIGRVGYIKISDYQSISITALKPLRKELKFLKICGISVLQFLLFMYFIYVDSPFHNCFMTFEMYILDLFIAQMGLRCK